MAPGTRARSRSSSEATAEVGVGWPDWVDAGAVRRLQEAIRSDAIGHAYLLSGPAGVGKAATAQAFAQALCCTHVNRPDRAVSCGVCRACRNVRRNAHPDVEIFSLATQAEVSEKPGRAATLTIDTVRRLRSAGSLFPLETDRRILVVDDAETLLEPAQQALLKTLEEPPHGVTLLLLVDEPDILLDTVRSRCQEITLSPVPLTTVRDALQHYGVSAPLAEDVAALSRGCAAWALQAVADKKLLDRRREERDTAARWLASPRYDQLVTAFTLGDQFGKRRADVIGVIQAAIQLLRSDMIAAATDADVVSESRTGSSIALNPALPLSRSITASLQCLKDLEANVRPRLALEAMVVAWPSLEMRDR